MFDVFHELTPDTFTASRPQNKQLGDVRAMRLVGRHGDKDLYGTHQLGAVKGRQQDSIVLLHSFENLFEKRLSYGLRRAAP